MATANTPKASRPLSPHLQIYRPQLTSGLSIFHRATGVALAVGLPVLVAWLVTVAAGPDIYADFINLFRTPVGQIALVGWTFCFFYHFFCGIRHLLWDMGIGLDIKSVYRSGYIALALAVLMTAGVWAKAYGMLS